ncbi:MAG: alpha/beta hydrolase [Pseudomonadota bacterium]|nr:alpha/beta hydrolase [Pseudomonadota bacterium]
MTAILIDAPALANARRFNRALAWAPRFKMRNRVMPLIIQTLLRASQLGADAALARRGIRVQKLIANGVPVRVLRGAKPVTGVVLDFHGGGWVIGNAAMDDKQNAALIAACGVAVVSVDYRLAPHTPLAGQMDDCLAASRWLLDGALPDLAGVPVFVVGESAGAHLAATMLLALAPAQLAKIAGAMLYYGVYDLAGTPSVQAAGADTLILDGPGMVTALRLLTPDATDHARRTAPLSPLYGDLAGMPPALMFAGTLDPLRDDSALMAARWRHVADCEMHLLPECPHGFIRFPTLLAARARERSHAWLRERLAVLAITP